MKAFRKWIPDQYQSIGESTALFKGLKQYNPKQPIKWGYKLWSQADMRAMKIILVSTEEKGRYKTMTFGLHDTVAQR